MRVVGRRGEPDGDLQLDRVGVLELVEQHPLVALVEGAADLDAVGIGEQSPGVDEQVVEVEHARVDATAHRVEHEPAGDRAGETFAVCPGRTG